MNKEFFYRILSSLILLPVVFFCIIKGSYYFNFLILISFFFTIYEWTNMVKNKKFKILGLIFLFVSYYTIVSIRNNFGDESIYLFLFILIICISTDLGGYIFGKAIKGPKLTKISPNKTFAGFFGGLILSILVTLLFIKSETNIELNSMNTNFIFQITVLISLVSQIGDLIVSYFKRLYNLKDTGSVIPGHGGILDRTDGMIFAFPFFYFLLILNIF